MPKSRRTSGEHMRRRGLRDRPVFWILIGVAFVAIVAVAATAWVGMRALDAKHQLEGAIPLATSTQNFILSGESGEALREAKMLRIKTLAAVSAAHDPVWRLVEWVPVAGPNLRAVRTVAEVVDELAERAVLPASRIDIESFQPVDGRIDVQAIRGLIDEVAQAKGAVDHAQEKLDELDRSGLISQVDAALKTLDTSFSKAADILDGLDTTVNVLPALLGADGPRNYLMMFQGNSEVRALGGNPAALALIAVDDGSLKITKQMSSSDFQNARRQPVTPLPPEVENVYSDIVGRWIPNITSTPDFPTTVDLMLAFWAEEDDTPIDGVISFDPVALSYLLNTTGPILLPTGDELTADNAIPLLLNEVYFRYSDPLEQNVFFASAAASIFDALTSGAGDPRAIVDQLAHATSEGRLLFWSTRPEEEKLLDGTRLSGVLPTSNEKSTVVGTYFNDVTGSKMDYYVEASVTGEMDACSADGASVEQTVTLTNTIDQQAAQTLPYYITGPYFEPGTIATDVVIYGPVGGSIDGWVASKGAQLRSTGTIDGRPVSRIYVELSPGQSVDITYSLSGDAGEYGPLELQTTPMVWPTPVEAMTKTCG